MSVPGLRRFFASYAAQLTKTATASPAPGLTKFLNDAHPLLRQLQTSAYKNIPPPPPNLQRLASTLTLLRKPLLESRKKGEFLQVWAVSGLKNNELRNAKVLAWLLNPCGSHGLGAVLLQNFLCEVRSETPSWPDLGTNLVDARVRTEECPLGSDRDRVDIAIDGSNFVLFVEVKINAAEGVRQLHRYSEAAREKANVLRKPHALVVYLSRSPPSDPPLGVAVITWRHVARALLKINADSLNGALVHQYAHHIRSFF